MKSSYYYTILVLSIMSFSSCKKDSTKTIHTENKTELKETHATQKVQNLQVVSKDSLELNQSNGVVSYNKIPFTGISQKRYPSGQESISIRYINGVRNGAYKKWFEDGSISYHSEYSNGKQEGTAKTWWKNGNLRSQSLFSAGLAHGKQIQWYKSGAKFKVIHLNKGKEEGMQTSWRENGKIYNNYEARNGRIFGMKRAALCFQLDDEKIVYAKK